MGIRNSKPPKYQKDDDKPIFISSLRENSRKKKRENIEIEYQIFKELVLSNITRKKIKSALDKNPELVKYLATNMTIAANDICKVNRLKKEKPEFNFELEMINESLCYYKLYLILNDDLLI